MNYIVYKTTNLINSKIYIGVHYTNPDIFDGYIGCGVSKKDRKKKVKKGFPEAVRKYGYENFKRETLFVYPDTEEGKLEAYAKEAELVNVEFIKKHDNYNLTVGGIFAPSFVLQKVVAQYTLDGKFIRVWNSITEAEQALNISNISQNLLGVSKYCGNFQWRYYTSESDENDIPAVEKKEKTVYQFDLQGNLIKVWPSAVMASKGFTNPTSARSGITQCCLKRKHQFGGYFWSFKNKFEFDPTDFKNTTPVAKYNDDGEFLESYSSLKEAAIANNIGGKNINTANIIATIRGSQKRCGGFRWRYFYGNKNNIKPLR